MMDSEVEGFFSCLQKDENIINVPIQGNQNSINILKRTKWMGNNAGN